MLLIYAILYLVFPITRYLVILLLNRVSFPSRDFLKYYLQRIEQRNQKRKENTQTLLQKLLQAEDKIMFAKKAAMKMEISEDNLVFTSNSAYPGTLATGRIVTEIDTELEYRAFQEAQGEFCR